MQSDKLNRVVLTIMVLLIAAIVIFGTMFFLDKFSPKEEISEEIKEEILEDRPFVVRNVIGSSVEGRDIEAYSFGTNDRENHLVFVGGIHGGYEWNSVFLAYKFIDYLEAFPEFIPENIKVTVIPSANPDGLNRVVGSGGRFELEDVPDSPELAASGRFNANGIDLNRNFGCKWKPESTWRGDVVSAGTSAFSEPEAQAINSFVVREAPDAFVFWHSQGNAVYASECQNGILPETLSAMNAYAIASGYTPIPTFDAYEITGDAEGWLASINIPAITVELKTHETIEWEQNLAGVRALFGLYK
ncbi:M14 family zinc carboxypeptidase [Candidatus Pacebacteria bacterium]|nr:M14 family zinc carboxypeptidase [Candidatus Paceibacterota bacterium]